MHTEAFEDYLREGGSCVLWESAKELGSEEEHSYQLWFAFCADQILGCAPEELVAARKTLAGALRPWMPVVLRDRPGSLPWHLDAKVAEFCAEATAWLEE